MKGSRSTLLCLVALCSSGLAANAQYTQIALPTYDDNLQHLTNGFMYPVSGPLMVGGVPFTLAADGNGNNTWSATPIFGMPQPPSNVLDIPVNVFGVTQAFTLINSYFGSFGSTVGTVEFKGSGGADASFDLTEGVNIRDHYLGGFNDAITPGTPEAVFGDGSVHLDRQTFTLPSEFAGQTLTDIVLTGLGGVTLSAQDGEPFIAGVTVTTSAVPEPGTLALALTGGLAGSAFAFRRMRRR